MRSNIQQPSTQPEFFQFISDSGKKMNDMTSDELRELMERLLRTASKMKEYKETKASQDSKKQAEVKEVKVVKEQKKQKESEAAQIMDPEPEEDAFQDSVCMDLPMDWENIYDQDERAQGIHFDSISDALMHSLSTIGEVDIEYIASITGSDYKTVINTLKGSIYQNPDTWNGCFYKGWETSDEYLSGNLIRKWKAAREADETYPGHFTDNLHAIERVLPPSVAAKDIYITLGSPWIPADIIDDFILYLLGNPFEAYYIRHYPYGTKPVFPDYYRVIHDEITGTWEIPCKSRYSHSISVRNTYGTLRMEALHILEHTLNMQTVTVFDEVDCPSNASGKKRVINKAETVAAIEKQKLIINEFRKWIWTDSDRKKRLERIFEENYSCIRKRIFDGSFLKFPGMSPDIHLYPYQKNAVARILFTPNTLLAHDVGAGKTYVMVAAGQELRRMGLSKKNMYVVPNNIVGQWKSIFLAMYPEAKLLCIEPKNFTIKKRKEMIARIRDEEYDGIIIAYSCFEMIPLSKNYFIEETEDKIELLSRQIKKKSKATAKLKKNRDKLKKDLDELYHKIENLPDAIFFDELGITRLFVDEAHNFKNVNIETKARTVLGLRVNGSRKCKDMMDKVHMIQKKNDGKGVVFATGTPITNSLTDAYIMQLYLQSGELAMLDLQSFDSWIGMFAEQATEFEIDVDTSSYRMATRFSRFHNLPELTALLSSIADFHACDQGDNIPAFDGYTDSLLSKPAELADYLEVISQRADEVRNGSVGRTEDNLLKITTDGRKAALDFRLIDPDSPFSYQSKVARCVENVAEIFYRTSEDKSTQLIFCDISTPKASFNIYDELKERLAAAGIPENLIAFIHDADTEAKRSSLFAQVRKGAIRILIGSTFKLGLGVNVQDRLIAIHHMDVPWRPADMTQREGRILRQGNRNPHVRIFRYITEGSFDAYSWQLLETKQRFINALLSGSMTERSGSDIEGTALNYAEVKALAIGNPLIRERVETANELSRFKTLQAKLVESKSILEQELLEIPKKKEHQSDLIKRCLDDSTFYSLWKRLHPPVEDSIEKKAEADERKILRDKIFQAVQKNILKEQDTFLMEYRGFQIFLPANMILEKPYIWLKRAGRYYIELGDTEVGNLIRIDNFLDSLKDYLEKLEGAFMKLTQRELDIQNELANAKNYVEEIEQCRLKLQSLDKQLGVK